jgi:quinolinate synthase
MKLNSLEKLEQTLTQLGAGEIFVSEELRQKALIPLERMMRITSGQSVDWSN